MSYTQAQTYFKKLRAEKKRAVLFEGAWGAPGRGYVFEIGGRVEKGSQKPLCGFKTYEGEDILYEILLVREFNEVIPPQLSSAAISNFSSDVSFDQYAQKISEIQELIAAGETYQVNYSIPFAVPTDRDPFEIYCALYAINPSPYSCFVEAENGVLISNSPECLMQLQPNGHLTTIPIKGTLARGKNPAEDERNAQALLQSEKNKAELTMIVDLERNDLGKVCTAGSVRVLEHRKIEKYSHVMHTVSVVEGHLEKNKSWRDALGALFPGGSVTGCPKKRTMEIIERLEAGKRGIYCGSAGFVLPDGEAIFNILIRSLWHDTKAQQLVFRSGGGIVADSVAQDEYAELLHKASAIMAVIS